MTSVNFTQKGNVFHVKVEGHAEYNPGGPDIVCAQCSMLFCTLMQCLNSENAEGNLIVLTHKEDEKEGKYYLCVKPKAETAGYIEVMTSVIASGYALLSRKYPDNVKFEFHQE